VRHVHRLGSEGLPDWDTFSEDQMGAHQQQPAGTRRPVGAQAAGLCSGLLRLVFANVSARRQHDRSRSHRPIQPGLKGAGACGGGHEDATTLLGAMEIAKRYDSLTWSSTSSRNRIAQKERFPAVL